MRASKYNTSEFDSFSQFYPFINFQIIVDIVSQ